MLEQLIHDVRFAVRALRRGATTTAVAALTLALGVGANTAVFSVFESVLVNPLPYAHADRLLSLTQVNAGVEGGTGPWEAREWASRAPSLAAIGVYTDGQWTMTGDGDADVLRGQRVNGTFFETLGAQPLLGRLLTADDDRPRANVVVLTHELWTRRFGGDPGVVGRTYTLNGAPHRIVGVLDRDFQPFRMTNAAEVPRIFGPIGYEPDDGPCFNCSTVRGVGRLADGATIERAASELAGAIRQIHDEHPAELPSGTTVRIRPLRDRITDAVAPALWIALGAAACVLLIACANLANLQLARATSRASEFALRQALGGSRLRIARQLLLESLLVAIAGCAGGVMLGRIGVEVLKAVAPLELPRLADIGVDVRVLVAAGVASLATALVAGLAPAWFASRRDLNDALKHHGVRAGGGRGGRARAALVIAQVSLAFALVAATGLLVRTVSQLLSLDAGFHASGVLTMTPVVGTARRMTPEALLQEKRQIIDAVQALPGVASAAMVNDVPLSHVTPFEYAIEGRPAAAGERLPIANVFWVEGEYFDALGIRLRSGRVLTRHDGTDAPPAAVVSESFARRQFPGGDALGHRIRLRNEPNETAWLTIVGIVGDVRNVGLDRAADEAVYQPLASNPAHYVRLVVRTDGDPSRLEGPIREAVRRIDPLVPIFHVQPMEDYVASSLAQRRFALALVSTFGVLALALAAIGLYGVLAQAVAARTAELAIRAALGATHRHLLTLVLARGFALTAIGIACGMLLTAWAAGFMTALLFEVHGLDPSTFAATTLVIALAAAAACVIPARRAARVDPVRAME